MLHRFVSAAVVLVWLVSATQAQTKVRVQHGFLVACSGYDKNELKTLPYTISEMQEFQRTLLQSGFESGNIKFLHDRQAERRYLPEKEKLVKEFRLMIERVGEEDTVIVALSGHGVQFKGDKRGYFCPLNADLSKPATLWPMDGSDDSVFEILKTCRAQRKLLIVNACRNDPASDLAQAARRVNLSDDYSEEVPQGIAAIYSCGPGQRSYYYDPADSKTKGRERSLFFHHLLEAWQGRYASGKPVTLEHVFEQVRVKTSTDADAIYGRSQVPQVKREYQGEWRVDGTVSANPMGPPNRPMGTPSRPKTPMKNNPMTPMETKKGPDQVVPRPMPPTRPDGPYEDLPKPIVDTVKALGGAQIYFVPDMHGGLKFTFSKSPGALPGFNFDKFDAATAKKMPAIDRPFGLRLTYAKLIDDASLKELGRFTKLHFLDLQGAAGTTNTGLAELGKLTELRHLNLMGVKQLTSEGTRDFGKLTKLRWLSLEGCREIDDATLKSISSLTSLNYLSLNYCSKITETGLRDLSGLKKLEYLDLFALHSLTDAALGTVASNHPELRVLLASSCDKFSDAGVTKLATLKHIKQLRFGTRKITDRSAEVFGGFTELESLDMDYTGIGDLTIQALAKLKSLRVVDVTGTLVSDAAFVHFAQMPRLESLTLTYCKAVHGEGIGALAKASSLRKLEMNGNSISDSALAEMKQLTQLTQMSLSNTKLNEGPFESLKKALPKCKISRIMSKPAGKG